MNKKTLKIAGWALGLSMAVAGIGATVGASYVATNNVIGTKAVASDSPYTLAFSSDVKAPANGKTLTNGGVTWTAAMTGGSIGSIDGTKGQQFGSKKSPCTAYSLTAPLADFGAGRTITSVKVNASTASGGTAKLSITAGGDKLLENQSLAETAEDYAVDELSVSSGSGDLVISFSNTEKAFYCKYITVEYEDAPAVTYDHIKIDSSSTYHTDYFVGESFDTSGLKVKAYTESDESDGGTFITAEYSVSPATFTAASPSASVTVTATYDEMEAEAIYSGIVVKEKPKFKVVSDPADLYVGQYVVIGTADGTYVLGSQNSNNRAAASATVTGSGDSLTITDLGEGYRLTLGIIDTYIDSEEGFVYTFNDGDGYLYAASSSANNLKTQDDVDGNAKFAVSIENRIASITAQGSNSRNQLKKNSSSALFSCYGSGQTDVALFASTDTPSDTQVVDTFVARYMHMNGSSGEGSGLCKTNGWYSAAEAAYGGLSDTQKSIFVSKYGGEDNAAKRLYWWALANGHNFDTETGVLAAATVSSFAATANVDKLPIIIITIIVASLASFATFAFLRRKKEDR